jgi:hypothetical protein
MTNDKLKTDRPRKLALKKTSIRLLTGTELQGIAAGILRRIEPPTGGVTGGGGGGTNCG